MKTWLSSELEILKRIVANNQLLANSINFALNTVFPYPEHPFKHNIMVGVNIPRTALGLDPKQKPGDIDYLIVPFTAAGLMLDRTIAIEAKIVRPTIEKPSKNANSLGVSQAAGLLRDGFPYVGLLHISIPEALPAKYHLPIPILGPNGELVKTGERELLDPFPIEHARRQEGRLIAANLPEEIGYKVVAFGLSRNNKTFSSFTMGESRSGKCNPQAKDSLLKQISEFLHQKPEQFSHIEWFK